MTLASVDPPMPKPSSYDRLELPQLLLGAKGGPSQYEEPSVGSMKMRSWFGTVKDFRIVCLFVRFLVYYFTEMIIIFMRTSGKRKKWSVVKLFREIFRRKGLIKCRGGVLPAVGTSGTTLLIKMNCTKSEPRCATKNVHFVLQYEV